MLRTITEQSLENSIVNRRQIRKPFIDANLQKFERSIFKLLSENYEFVYEMLRVYNPKQVVAPARECVIGPIKGPVTH